ncbi:MAG: hypothetical protein J6L64_01515 [Opitutales bacterium]|nr:hypothetical protein [Opitutales bacterium]
MNNFPELPSGFHAGDPVRAEDFNKMLNWMRAVENLINNRAPESTVPAAVSGAWRPLQRAPFEVDIEYDESGDPAKIIIARGNVFAKMVHPSLDNDGMDSEEAMEYYNALARCEVPETEIPYAENAKIVLCISGAGWTMRPDVFVRVCLEEDKKNGEVLFPLADLRTEGGNVIVTQHHTGSLFFAWSNWSTTAL